MTRKGDEVSRDPFPITSYSPPFGEMEASSIIGTAEAKSNSSLSNNPFVANDQLFKAARRDKQVLKDRPPLVRNVTMSSPLSERSEYCETTRESDRSVNSTNTQHICFDAEGIDVVEVQKEIVPTGKNGKQDLRRMPTAKVASMVEKLEASNKPAFADPNDFYNS
eukprot:GHVH01006416.1.p1 GENE.GHVH01006416.1~~GHVH01006416.1.p1  ORF type:complete len:165 (-),score=18.96 GHVH01006416.1:341-835(-)